MEHCPQLETSQQLWRGNFRFDHSCRIDHKIAFFNSVSFLFLVTFWQAVFKVWYSIHHTPPVPNLDKKNFKVRVNGVKIRYPSKTFIQKNLSISATCSSKHFLFIPKTKNLVSRLSAPRLPFCWKPEFVKIRYTPRYLKLTVPYLDTKVSVFKKIA